jgi:phosphate transport system protein
MSLLVEDRVAVAVDAAIERRAGLARPVIDGDAEVNRIQRQLDERCLQLLAQQQPVARDLRLITSVMKVAGDLERVGDLAVNIAGNAMTLASLPPVAPLPELARIGSAAQLMLHDAVHAYLAGDVEVARRVLAQDDEVDGLRNQVFRLVIDRMLHDPREIEPGLGLILVSRNLERVADHATNVAEDVVFLVEARDVRHMHPEP